LKIKKAPHSNIKYELNSLSVRIWKKACVKLKEGIELISKAIDYIFIPIAMYYDKRGFNFYEVKVSALGHHLFEPIAIALINKNKEIGLQKKITLLVSKNDALVPYTNTILKQQFNIIEKYSFLNLEYWLARNLYCGISRNSDYKVFMDAHYRYRNQLNIFNLDYLNDDDTIKELIKTTNVDNRYIVVWKPRCYRSNKHYPSRYSGIESIVPIIEQIYSNGGLVYGLLYGNAELEHPGLYDLRRIKNNSLRAKFVYYLDYNCKYAITGQTGGGVPQIIFLKPILAYDLALPYSLHFSGPKTIIAPKKAQYKDGKYVDLQTLLNLKNEKQIEQMNISFINNSPNDMVNLHLELLERIEKYPKEFAENSYMMNNDWGELIPRNIYNSFGHSQIADYSYLLNKNTLFPKWKS